MRWTSVFMAGAAVALGGCGGATGPDLCDNLSSFEVQVDAEVTFVWGSCHLTGLDVFDQDGRVLWEVEGDLVSPVIYGHLPAGATGDTGAPELREGFIYSVLATAGEETSGHFQFLPPGGPS